MTIDQAVVEEAVGRFATVPGRVPRRIGYVVNFSFHIWYKLVVAYMNGRAAQYGMAGVTVRDANQSLATELGEMDALISSGVDALVVTPVPAAGVEAIVEKAARAKIPLVIEANPVPGMSTLVAICDYDAGVKSGRWAGEDMKRRGIMKGSLLDISFPVLRPCLLRSEGFLDGLRSVLPESVLVERVNGEARVDVAQDLTAKCLSRHPEVNVIFGIDDESIHGGSEAIHGLNLEKSRFTLVGFGLAGDEEKERLHAGGLLKASLAMFPEWVGMRCIDQAVRLFNGVPVRTHDVVPTVPVAADHIERYFSRNAVGWAPRFDVIGSIPVEDRCART
jgi:ribose transport system substrate-binding protein